MALLPLDIIKVQAPALAADPGIEVYLELAELRTSPASTRGWSEGKRALAVALRVMHEMTIQKTRPLGEAGSLDSKVEGELSVTFSDRALQISASKGSAISLDLSQTQYGRRLIGLIKGTFIPFGIAGQEASPGDWDVNLWGGA